MAKSLKDPKVTADVVWLYPKIPHGVCSEAIRKSLNEMETPRVPSEELIKKAHFLLKTFFFNSTGRWKNRNRGPPLVLNYLPPYARIFMDVVETEFLTSQYLHFLWLHYIDNIFLYGLMEKKSSLSFLKDLISTLI